MCILAAFIESNGYPASIFISTIRMCYEWVVLNQYSTNHVSFAIEHQGQLLYSSYRIL